jgi:hypothetical protein
MRVPGIIAIVISLVLLLAGVLLMNSAYYNGPFDSPEQIKAVCESHQKVVGADPVQEGEVCSHLVEKNGKPNACRKGKVTVVGGQTMCAAPADEKSGMLIIGGASLLAVGLVLCLIPSHKAHHARHKK